jgi:hypothetical protein
MVGRGRYYQTKKKTMNEQLLKSIAEKCALSIMQGNEIDWCGGFVDAKKEIYKLVLTTLTEYGEQLEKELNVFSESYADACDQIIVLKNDLQQLQLRCEKAEQQVRHLQDQIRDPQTLLTVSLQNLELNRKLVIAEKERDEALAAIAVMRNALVHAKDIVDYIARDKGTDAYECKLIVDEALSTTPATNKLLDELKELREDKERLDWLEQHPVLKIYNTTLPFNCPPDGFCHSNLRTAIDSARKEQE